MISHYTRISFLILLFSFQVSAQETQNSDPTAKRIDFANTITADDLSALLYSFASDSMQGRMTATPGQKKAA